MFEFTDCVHPSSGDAACTGGNARAAKRLRTEYGRKATLIAATGYGQSQDCERSTEAGFDCHLVKPVSIGDLVLLLDQKTADAEPRSTPLD